MSSLLRSFEELSREIPSVSKSLKNHKDYWAHTKKGKAPESLSEHLGLVLQYCAKQTKAHNLDPVVDGLINTFLKGVVHEQEYQAVGEAMKIYFLKAISFHDHGKVNENFQALPGKMNNPNFNLVKSPIDSQHSILSAYIFITQSFNEIQFDKRYSGKSRLVLFWTVLAFSYPIFKHHSRVMGDGTDCENRVSIETELAQYFSQYLEKFDFDIHQAVKVEVFAKIKSILKKADDLQVKQHGSDHAFPLYSLVRLCFSLLTASDYLASGEYMSGIKVTDFGVLARERIKEIAINIQEKDQFRSGKPNYNKQTYLELENYRFQRPTEPNGDNLNLLRKEMAIEVIQNVRSNRDKNLFYIEAPTGGGKTNLSMLAAVELLVADQRLNKVFYVFPFTTLVTQTYQSIIDTLGLQPEEVVQLHSKAGLSSGKSKEGDEEDAQYGSEKKNYIDHLFAMFPFCLMTHIRFFDIIKTNEKQTNYLLHRLANSVVVLDELQSYDPLHWDKVVYFIRQYARYYNIKFILMSATLPKLDKLKIKGIDEDVFTDLIPNAKKHYFQNPNFSERVDFQFEALPAQKSDAYQKLAHRVLEESERYANQAFGEAKPEGSVYTVVEFIFKKSASDFYRYAIELDFFDEIFVLSGTILEHRRRYIINFLKRKENREKKVLLITTQVVEAGVDIDMDLGFKNISLIDSDEQLAGRINRNVNKKDCRLFLFKINEPGILHKDDPRYQLIIKQERITQEDHLNILKSKDFDQGYYDKVIKYIDDWNEQSNAVNLSDYTHHVQHLNFQKASEQFKLIDQQNISVFVPIQVPLVVDGTESGVADPVFSEEELRMLLANKIFDQGDQYVDGKAVYDHYESLINNKGLDFSTKSVSLKMLQGIISKFVFSVFKSAKMEEKLTEFSDHERIGGYCYLRDWAGHGERPLYTLQMGLDESVFEDTDNQIL